MGRNLVAELLRSKTGDEDLCGWCVFLGLYRLARPCETATLANTGLGVLGSAIFRKRRLRNLSMLGVYKCI